LTTLRRETTCKTFRTAFGYVAQGPRIYDSNSTGGADPDLEAGVGNLLIIQETDKEEPDDNEDGGSIKFFFEETSIILQRITLVDNNVQSMVSRLIPSRRRRLLPKYK